jgi:uncharacterized protein YecT (DUF1311 family)
MKTLLVLCLALAAPLAAHASSQGEAIISGMNVCMNHSSGAEALRCAKDGFAAADRLLNKEYAGAIQRIRNNENALGETGLRAEQREWLNERNTKCGGSPDSPVRADGSVLGAAEYACFARMSVDRADAVGEILAD